MIVVCGEALMDVFTGEATATGMTLDARIGGSPFNVAIGLARLGRVPAFFGGVSKGALGERLARALSEEGVMIDSVVRLAAPTTLALVELDAAGVPDYAFYGEGAADRSLTVEHLDRVPLAACYHFGSFNMVVEPTASTLRRLAARERARAVIAWDPNIRLNVEPDLDRWRALFSAMTPLCHILKASEEDLSLLYPGHPVEELAAGWLKAGVSLAVVTRGAAGVSAWTARSRVDAPTPQVVVADTVGAGDTFQAALLAGLAERGVLNPAGVAALDAEGLAQILQFAAAAAAVTCSRRGADLPTRDEVTAFLAE